MLLLTGADPPQPLSYNGNTRGSPYDNAELDQSVYSVRNSSEQSKDPITQQGRLQRSAWLAVVDSYEYTKTISVPIGTSMGAASWMRKWGSEQGDTNGIVAHDVHVMIGARCPVL
jgi:hypothetical protein